MKKTLIALAAVAVSSAAFAQATITGTFNLDTANTVANSDTTIGMGDAIVNFGVSEDLGGGLKASASTSLQTNNGRGGAATNHGYSFGLSGGFGGLSFRNYLVGNAETSAGISAASDMSTAVGGYFVRNRLQYALPAIVPNLGIQLRWDQTQSAQTSAITVPAEGLDAGDTVAVSGNTLLPTAATRRVKPTGDTTKINFDYTIGQGYISYGTLVNDFGKNPTFYLGYNFGVANVDLALTSYDHTEIAITAPLGANLSAGLQVQTGDVADATGVRLTYAMSKRTRVSFNYVDIAKSTATTAGNNYRVRVSHSF